MRDRDLIGELDLRLAQALARFPTSEPSTLLHLPAPSKLGAAAQQVATKFIDGKPAEPPSQARINALARLRRQDPTLNRRDWNLIAWGLCDECGRAGKPIDDADMIAAVLAYLDAQVNSEAIGRRFWFGLLHSYFAYTNPDPSSNAHWLALRTRLATTAAQLVASQRRPKAWAMVLDAHLELLAPAAGTSLADAIFRGDTTVVAELKTYLPIPDGSWLWQRIITAQLQRLSRVSDEVFYPVIPAMLQLAAQHPQQTDDVISALLTRYQQSAASEQAHDGLKQFALAHWQNPQIKMANRWALVSEEVRKMVLHWFAVADLQHFFSLLQGAGGVDRDRLHYWLRFVGQISYTRIVMGGDAIGNSHPDFVDFRDKNRGRYSALHGGDTANNAFIMRIGGYYFVEFSGKGNACYLYDDSRVPFNPESRNFTLANLKRRDAATDRIVHNGSWESSADWMLRRLGIYPDEKRDPTRAARVLPPPVMPVTPPPPSTPVATLPQPVPNRATTESPGASLASSRASPFAGLFTASPSSGKQSGTGASMVRTTAAGSSGTTVPGRPPTAGQAVRLAKELQAVAHVGFSDFRVHGGAFWVLEKNPDSDLAKQLLALGFKYREGRGHWIK